MRAATSLKVQVGVVGAGTLFAGTTVAADLYRYLLIGGDLAQFGRTPLANPLVTPCFYGALAFAVALGSAVRQLGRRDPQHQIPLAWLLLASALLGLGNVGYQCYLAGPASCFRWTILNPLETPCLVGSLLSLAGLGTAVAARRSLRRQPAAEVAAEPRLPTHHGVS